MFSLSLSQAEQQCVIVGWSPYITRTVFQPFLTEEEFGTQILPLDGNLAMQWVGTTTMRGGGR